MEMDKLLESKKKIRNINTNNDTGTITKKLSFEEKYKRLTTYVENDLYNKVKILKQNGDIRTMTDFVNEAFKEYIENHL